MFHGKYFFIFIFKLCPFLCFSKPTEGYRGKQKKKNINLFIVQIFFFRNFYFYVFFCASSFFLFSFSRSIWIEMKTVLDEKAVEIGGQRLKKRERITFFLFIHFSVCMEMKISPTRQLYLIFYSFSPDLMGNLFCVCVVCVCYFYIFIFIFNFDAPESFLVVKRTVIGLLYWRIWACNPQQ